MKNKENNKIYKFITFRLPVEEYNKIDNLAKSENRKKANFVENIIRDFLKNKS